MKFKQYKNGSCDIIFEDSEVEIINNNKKMHLSDETLRHFGNTLFLLRNLARHIIRHILYISRNSCLTLLVVWTVF